MDEQIQFAICLDNGGYRASLEPLKVYMVLPNGEPDLGLIRVVDESGEGYLYPSSAFMVIDVPRGDADHHLYERLQLEAGKAADAPADALPDAVRPWLTEAEEFIEENEPVLADPELDSITNSYLATEATSRLKEASGAITRLQNTKKASPRQMLEVTKAYRKLLTFSKSVIKHYDEHFAEEQEHPHSQEMEESYSAVEEAKRYLQ